MTEFLQQVSEMGNDSVKDTSESMKKDVFTPLAQVEDFNKLKVGLSKALSESIDSKGIKDDVTSKIVESSNNDITELMNLLGDNTQEKFDIFKTKFIQKFYGGPDGKTVDAYIDSVVSKINVAKTQEDAAAAKEKFRAAGSFLGIEPTQ